MFTEPIALSCFIFVYWTLAGYGVVRELAPSYSPTRVWLLSPVAGVSMLVLIATPLSRLGLPAKDFSAAVLATVACGSLTYFLVRRPRINFLHCIPWLAIFLLILILLDWPSFKAGFDWVSFGNGDMLAYVTGANHFLAHGLYTLPPLHTLLQDREMSWDFSFVYSIGEVRWGSQLILAMLVAVIHIPAGQAYMPLICAFYLSVAAAAGALLSDKDHPPLVAQLGTFVMGTSSTFAQGTFNQLMPQDFGIASLTAAIIATLEPSDNMNVLRSSCLSGFFLAAMLVVYPEVLPFFIAPLLLRGAIILVRRRPFGRPTLTRGLLASAFLVVFANITLVGAIHLLVWAAPIGNSSGSAELFPYYLTPEAFALGWGLIPYGSISGTSLFDQGLIVGGFVLFVSLFFVSAKRAWSASIPGTCSLVLLVTFLELFHAKSGFGLSKLAMYSQPFVLGCAIEFLFLTYSKLAGQSNRRIPGISARSLSVAMLILGGLFVARNINVITHYGVVSLGEGSVLTELPSWTRLRVLSQLQTINTNIKGPVISDAFDKSIAMFEGAYLAPDELLFMTPSFIGPYALDATFNVDRPWSYALNNDSFRKRLFPEVRAHNDLLNKSAYIGGDSTGRGAFDTFFLDPRVANGVRNGAATMFLESPNPTVFNSWGQSGVANSRTLLTRYADVKNYLVYVFSSRADYNDTTAKKMIWNYEADPVEGGVMEASGRYLLFNVVNPTRGCRLEVSLTSSFEGGGNNAVPPLSVIGKHRLRLPVLGDGAMRLYSDPLEPATERGLKYIEIDMGRDGREFPFKRTGILGLYNANLNFDYRRTVGFLRDISIVTNEQLKKLVVPTKIANFRSDLRNPALQFSGFYEDGWMAGVAQVWLRSPKQRRSLFVIHVATPEESAASHGHLTVTIDGRLAIDLPMVGGDMSHRVSFAGDGLVHHIIVRSSTVFNLPHGDGRPASTLVREVGFE